MLPPAETHVDTENEEVKVNGESKDEEPAV